MYPLHLNHGHLFIEIDGGDWLVDTGSPTSFGDGGAVALCGQPHHVATGYGPVTIDWVREMVGCKCAGLLGGDILNNYDFVFDLAGGSLLVTEEDLEATGVAVPLEGVMGVPIITVGVGSHSMRMALDTGAQHSYLQHPAIEEYPKGEIVEDFAIGEGTFQLQLHAVPIRLGGVELTLPMGTRIDGSVAAITAFGLHGVVGLDLFKGRVVTYCPRRSTVYIQP